MSKDMMRWMSDWSVAVSSGKRSLRDLDKNSKPPNLRSPCVLCLDGSGSMKGVPIRELNEGLRQFFDEVRATQSLKDHLDLAILRFSGDVQVVRPMGPLGEEAAQVIAAGGETNLGEALGRALELIERSGRRAAPDGDGRPMPWLIVMTDGRPTDRWEEQAWRVRSLASLNELMVLAIGIGPEADMGMLEALCSPDLPPMRLSGLRFADFFTWLKRSLAISDGSKAGERPALPPPSTWLLRDPK
jgi:uncharacterized protein YegL